MEQRRGETAIEISRDSCDTKNVYVWRNIPTINRTSVFV